MSKEDLEQKKADIENRHKQVLEELHRLEGEFRLVQDLLKGADEVPDTKPQRLRKVEAEDATN